MSRFSISSQARQDLDDIWLYILPSDNIVEADRMMDLFEDKFRLLASQPMMGTAREELAVGLRFFPVGNYIIFYRPENGVNIYRVLRGSLPIDSGYFEG